jgi:ZIP family zinc transporter
MVRYSDCFACAGVLTLDLAVIPLILLAGMSTTLRSQGYSMRSSFLTGVLSGVVEPICPVAALVLVGLFRSLLPCTLAFAGGAMLYVIFDEMVPESYSHSYERAATTSFMIGFLFMTILSYLATMMRDEMSSFGFRN